MTFIDTTNWGVLFPSTATLQSQSAGATNSRGVPLMTWANVAGLINLPCQISLSVRSAEEMQGTSGGEADGAISYSTHEVIFQTFHAAITEKMRLIIGGEIYDIIIAGRDPAGDVSLLKVRLTRG